jgi:hypothetical protein
MSATTGLLAARLARESSSLCRRASAVWSRVGGLAIALCGRGSSRWDRWDVVMRLSMKNSSLWRRDSRRLRVSRGVSLSASCREVILPGWTCSQDLELFLLGILGKHTACTHGSWPV